VASSHALLCAQIAAGQVFPRAMQDWIERHAVRQEPARESAPVAPRRRGRPPRKNPRRAPVANRDRAILILNHVSEREDVLVEEIVGTSRERRVFLARRRAVKLMRRLGFSLNQIGHAINRDHASVLNCIRPKRSAGK
jgi:hypothetical protein